MKTTDPKDYVYIVVRDGMVESINTPNGSLAVCVFDMKSSVAQPDLEKAIRHIRKTTTEIEYWSGEEIYGDK
jgi:hypothetical protein